MNIVKGGRSIYGEAIGILVLETTYPAIPGNVANASTYQFPVRYKVLEGIPSDWWCDEEGASERRQEIFDFISLINMVYSVVVKQPYLGFM